MTNLQDNLQKLIAELKEEGLIKTKDVSDGYHTFGELYHHRAVLFSIICNTYKDKAWKSLLHDDGTMFDGDMFIVGVETPEGQYTYHYHIDPYWEMFDVKEVSCAPKFDGHKPSGITRLFGLLKESPQMPNPSKLTIMKNGKII